jgi:hypothetical protein
MGGGRATYYSGVDVLGALAKAPSICESARLDAHPSPRAPSAIVPAPPPWSACGQHRAIGFRLVQVHTRPDACLEGGGVGEAVHQSPKRAPTRVWVEEAGGEGR